MQEDFTELPHWLLEDNQNRTDKYSRNLSDEMFLRHLNSVLEPYENEVPVNELEPYPIIFFFGLPRCGKTFFSQLLVHALDLGYPDNITARFWEAPSYGIHLSRILLKDQDFQIKFSSDYGKTNSLVEPHDFAYFWHKWLKCNNIPYDYESVRDQIDWPGLRTSLSRMSHKWRKCSIFKGVNPSYHLSRLSKTYNKSLFIYVQRDPIDIAVSLRKGRLDNYDDLNKWYGQTPHPDIYHDLIHRPYNEQIGGQLKHLSEMYESELNHIPSDKIIRISYRNFCENPNSIISDIQERIYQLFNCKIDYKFSIDSSYVKYSSHNSDLPFYNELVDGLKKFKMPITLI